MSLYPLEGQSVLIIDDEQDIRDGCERFLTRMGLAVRKAENGEKGLISLAEEPADLVLLDLKMPGLDGMEVLGRIKERWPEMLVVIITGFATVETAIEAMKRGAYDFIPKPFQPDHLRLTVGRALERKRLLDQARRLQAERARTLIDLDNEKSRTRTIIRALPFGMVVTDTEGKVALMNPAFRRMVNLPPDAAVGRPVEEYVSDPEFRGLVRAIGGGERGQGEEGASVEFNAGERYLLARGTRVASDEGEPLGAVVVLVDLTPFRNLEGVSGEFVAKVSHELRSPLSTIYLQLSLLLDDGQDRDQENLHLLERAKDRTQGLISFVRDMMDLSRIESGASAPAEPLMVDQVLAQVTESLATQAEAKGQSLTISLPEGETPPVLADRTSLESVFTNLVQNAVNYTPEGGSIQVRAAAANGWVQVEVEDDGFGIEPEKHQAVFDKFYRVKNEKTRYVTGTGLGLPIVKSVVEALGGRIELKSAPGQGSTFRVVLPAAK